MDDPLRAPNAWFDAKPYLAAYPDRVPAGVTAATALYHYATYGICEDRSPAGNVNPVDFTYFLYAANNPDLEPAFGISDANHLAILQQHELLAHYLSYGIDDLDDTFTATDLTLPGVTLKGFGGNDTLNANWISFGHSAALILDSVEGGLPGHRRAPFPFIRPSY